MKAFLAFLATVLIALYLFTDNLSLVSEQGSKEKLQPQVAGGAQTTQVAADSLAQLPVEQLKAKPTDNPDLQDKLAATFKLHRRFIEKCFIKHYQKVKGQTQSGTVILRFDINKKGRLQNVEVDNSDYKDDEFHQCLIEVTSRVRFKYANPKTISVRFPLKMSLP